MFKESLINEDQLRDNSAATRNPFVTVELSFEEKSSKAVDQPFGQFSTLKPKSILKNSSN